MSFDQLSSVEAQPSTMRRSDDPQYRDDPDFDRHAKSISDDLFGLNSNISQLSRDVARIGTRNDNQKLRERIHNLLEETRAGIRRVGEGVKKIQTWEDVNPSQKWTQQKLSSQFATAMAEFQTIQRSALEKQRAAVTAMEEGEAPSGEAQPQQQQQLLEQQAQLANQSEVDFQESLIIERETEIRNIEQSMGELNELFRDVSHIVHEQGTQLDNVYENVERVTHDTRGANVELRGASRSQKKARNTACCVLVIVAIIVAIIVLAVTLG